MRATPGAEAERLSRYSKPLMLFLSASTGHEAIDVNQVRCLPPVPIGTLAEAKLKRFPAKPPKEPVDARAVAADTLKRYPGTMARPAE